MPEKRNTMDFKFGDSNLLVSMADSKEVLLKDTSGDKPQSAITEHKKNGRKGLGGVRLII